jgi:hypothetical protein
MDMKKLPYFVLAFLLFGSSLFAATPVQFTDPYNVVATTKTVTGDSAIKATPGYLQSVLVSWKGATVGDTVDINDNSAAGGTVLVRITLATANGSFYYQPVAPIPYPTTGIYCDLTLSGGAASVTVQYS